MPDSCAALTVTVITSRHPVNKRYVLQPNGTLDKHAVAAITDGIAQSYVVRNADEMAELLERVTASDNMVIVAGRFHSDDGTPFRVVSARMLARMLGVNWDNVPIGIIEHNGERVAARLAAGIDSSSWILFDADNPPGMPAEWVAMNIHRRLALWEPLLPGISRTTRVELRASSARVVKDGGHSKDATHAWIRVNDANMIAMMKAFVGVTMVNAQLSFPFEKKSRADRSRTVGIEHRGLFDHSVWNVGRIVFCSIPDISAAPGYYVDDADIAIVDGGELLDLSLIRKPDALALREYRKKTGVGLDLKIGERGSLSVISRGELTLDTEIEVKRIVKPLREWITGLKTGERLRCEAPFRESSSEAAFIRIGGDGQPFVHDSGTGTTYRLASPGDDIVMEFNERYMVVNEAGRTIVYEAVHDPVLSRLHYVPFTFEDFKKLHLNRQVIVRHNAKGKPQCIDAGTFWLKHPNRHQYARGVVFDPSRKHERPDVLNLWQGFAVEPRLGGSWAKLRDHILTIICDGNREHFDYLMGWLARLVQYPAQQGEVAVVLRGGEGTGKGTLASAIRYLFGPHGLAVSNSEHLVGRFNGHLRDVVFLFADEAFYAGNKAHIGALKSLITEPRLPIEAKYKNPIEAPNFIHLMMASNEAWVVPAAVDSRRFFVLDVSSTRANDHAYFTAIRAELEAGGYEAMLYDLRHHDLLGFNVRRVPQTAALNAQRLLSLDTATAWWRDVLHEGRVGLESNYAWEWKEQYDNGSLHASYLTYVRIRHEFRPMDQTQLGRFLETMGGRKKRPHGKVRGYTFGTLAEAREAFCHKTGLVIDWPE